MTPLIIAKVAILLALTLMLLPTFRRASASLRYVVLLAGLAASLLLPVVDAVTPEWRVLPEQAKQLVTQEPERPGAVTVAVAPAPVDNSAANVPTPVTNERADIDFGAVAETVWVLGAAVLLFVLLLRATRLSLAVRRAPILEDTEWCRELDTCRRLLGMTRTVAIRTRAAGSMPAVWGVFSPTVLLPEDCSAWSPDRRRAVLLHELAHVARQDVAVSLLINAACALHWFNPLVWVIKRKLEAEREQACDDIALASGLSQKQYATHLLETAADCRQLNSLAPVMAGRSQLEERIMAILDNTRERSSARRGTQAFTTLVTVIAMLTLSSITFAEPNSVWRDIVAANGDQNPAYGEFAEHLATLGIAADDTDALITALQADLPLTRAAAAAALGRNEEPRAVDALLEAGYDEDALVRQWAVRALVYDDDPRILELLNARLQDTDAETRQWAVRGMKVFGSNEFTQPLLNMLGDSDAEVREWAVRTLALSDDPTVVDALATLLQIETDAHVAEWAVRSLGGHDDEVAMNALITSLRSPTADVREWAVRGLSGTTNPDAVIGLISALNDSTADVREWAARSLSGSADPDAVGGLILALNDSTPDVREWAARGLAGNTDPEAVNGLILALNDSAADVREWSVRSLGVCGNEVALGPLEVMRNDPSDDVREWADRSIEAIRCNS